MRGSSIVIPCMYPEMSHKSRCVPNLVLESSVLHSSPHSPLRCVFAQLCPTLRPHGLGDFSGKNTGVGCHLLLWGIFLIQGSNLSLLHWQADSLPPGLLGSPSHWQQALPVSHHTEVQMVVAMADLGSSSGCSWRWQEVGGVYHKGQPSRDLKHTLAYKRLLLKFFPELCINAKC